eukprot:COSAG02_NODE_3669_length_6398_cov_3.034132_3_plen_218_part_00
MWRHRRLDHATEPRHRAYFETKSCGQHRHGRWRPHERTCSVFTVTWLMAAELHSAIPEVWLCLLVHSSNLRRGHGHVPACERRNFPRALVCRAGARPADPVIAHATARSCCNPDVNWLVRAAHVECRVAHGRGGTDALADGNDEPPRSIGSDVVARPALFARVELGCSVRRSPVAANAEDAVLRELAVVTLVVWGGRGAEAVVKERAVAARGSPLQP